MTAQRNSGASRRFLGGRSKRHLNKAAPTYVPAWTDAAALAANNSFREAHGATKKAEWLEREAAAGPVPKAWAQALARQPINPEQRELAMLILGEHCARIAAASRGEGRRTVATAVAGLLRSMNRRAACVRRVHEVELPLWRGATTRAISSFISKDVRRDRLRSTASWTKSLARLRAWPGRPTRVASVVQPETARRRVLYERGGRADAAFLLGCEHRAVMPTATANRGDQWFWLHLLRPLSLEEALRASGASAVARATRGAPIPESPLRLGLDTLSDVEALCALGRAVHFESARLVLRRLLERRSPHRRDEVLTYASAFTGIDTVAAALDGVFNGVGWRYEFLAESDEKMRAAATAAWTTRGLDALRAHKDARCLESEAWVEMFCDTSECVEFSKKKHGRTHAEQARSLHDLSLSLGYVREKQPHLVLLENVDEPEATVPISGMLGSLAEYEWERIVICPYQHLGWPVRRRRSFWLGWLRNM